MLNSLSKPPIQYDFKNLYNASINPSEIHTQNIGLFFYYGDYLLKKIISVFKFSGLPDTWAENYFKYILFGCGYIAIFKSKEYGVIPQHCSLSDNMTLFYQPKRVLIANPVLKEQELEIGKNCELIKLQPDYTGIMDIVSYYADMLAVCSETVGVNLLNSKVSYVFFAKNKAEAETFKKAYDKVSKGNPFVVLDKDNQSEEGRKEWDFFLQNVGNSYIVDKVLDDMKTIEDQFNTKVGIPNANTQKRERLISSEVEANDIDTKALVNIWLDTLNNDIMKVNKKYDLNLSVKYRYEGFFNKENQEVIINE